MAENDLVFSGLQPTINKTGTENWFLIDKAGAFQINHTIKGKMWVVGSGKDGTAGEWNGNRIETVNNPIPNTATGTSYAGNGGDGGIVAYFTDILIPKDSNVYTTIGLLSNPNGTDVTIDGKTYRCTDTSEVRSKGGKGGYLPPPEADKKYTALSEVHPSESGVNGIETPYGYVGSSGGGGAVCTGVENADNGLEGGIGAGDGRNHRQAGTDATNYGCGGGGGAICGAVAEGQSGGKGEQGCIIIEYETEEDYIDPVKNPPKPNVPPVSAPEKYIPTVEKEKKYVIIRNYKKTTTVTESEDKNAATSSSSVRCCSTNDSDCGCGGSARLSDGKTNGNYTNDMNVRSNTNALARKLQLIETENLNMLKQISALENKRGIL